MNVISDTLRTLEETALYHESVLVAYSGGKDSLAVLDLCSKVFRRVVAFHMYFIPGLRCIERQLQYARDRWGVVILQYPHWLLVDALKGGAYSPNPIDFDDVPNFKLNDIHKIALEESGCSIVAHGGKKTDGLWRRRTMAAGSFTNVTYPIAEWNKFEVMAYLQMHDIPSPLTTKHKAIGIDLSDASLLWLHDTYPEDFERLTYFFPYAPAVVKHRELYGEGE